MARIKRGMTKHRRHVAVLALTKGHYTVRHRLYKRAKDSLKAAMSYATIHRRDRKGDFRGLWIVRIGAAAKQNSINYSTLMHGLKLANIQVDRKILADLAVKDPQAFSELANRAKAQLVPAT